MVGYLSQNYLCFNNRELIQETLNDLSLDVLKQTLASILKAPLVRLMVLNKDTQAGYKGDFFQSNAGLPGAFFNRADLDGRCRTGRSATGFVDTSGKNTSFGVVSEITDSTGATRTASCAASCGACCACWECGGNQPSSLTSCVSILSFLFDDISDFFDQ